MKESTKQIKMDFKMMSQYIEYIEKETPDSIIFKIVRDIQDSAMKQETKISNSGEFYWFLIRQRDKIRAA